MLINLLILILGSFMLLAAFAVISVKNPIYSILYLIFVFFLGSCLLIIIDAEFLAMVLLIVYIGAIAVLFLFIVMMIKVKGLEIKNEQNFLHPITLLIFIFLVIFFFLIYPFSFDEIPLITCDNYPHDFIALNTKVTNIEAIGLVLYTAYGPVFLMASLVLLTAMIGSIILTLTNKSNPKKQNLFEQQVRDLKKTLILKKFN